MEYAIQPTLTRAGLAALRNARGTGLLADIDRMVFGRGVQVQGVWDGYTPSRTQTALKAERARVPILSGTLLGDPNGTDLLGFRVLAEVPPVALAADAYNAAEVGFLLTDGTLFAVWSAPGDYLAAVTTKGAVDVGLDVFTDQIPPNTLTITVQAPDIPDTTVVLAGFLRAIAKLTTQQILTNERLIARGIY